MQFTDRLKCKRSLFGLFVALWHLLDLVEVFASLSSYLEHDQPGLSLPRPGRCPGTPFIQLSFRIIGAHRSRGSS